MTTGQAQRKCAPSDITPIRTTTEQQSSSELMAQIGAPRFEPVPPDQVRWPALQPGLEYSPEIRLWSAIMTDTIGFATTRPRSPYAVDEVGRPKGIQDYCDQFDWDISNGRKYQKRLELRGVIRKGTKQEGKSRIYLTGKVSPVEDLENALSLVEGEDEAKKVCANLFSCYPQYILQQIEKLPKDRQQAIAERLSAIQERDKLWRVDLDEARRTIVERHEDIIFRDFEIRKIRVEQKIRDEKRAAELAERNQRVQPLVSLLEKRFAQTFSEKGTRKPENEVCANPTIFIDRENNERTTSSSSVEAVVRPGNASTTAVSALSEHTIQEAIGFHAPADPDAVRMLIEGVRRFASDATQEEIIYAIHEKGAIASNKRNPVGFLLTAVPNMFRGPQSWRETLKSSAAAECRQKSEASDRYQQHVVELRQRLLNPDKQDDALWEIEGAEPPELAELIAWARAEVAGRKNGKGVTHA